MLRRKSDERARVIRAGYFFPSPKGEGVRIERNQTHREELYEVLKDLFELLGAGVFPTTYDKEPCGICPYGTICGGQELAVARSKKKMTTDKKMEPIERLKGHA
jgi:CRISPR/Cas system-associated exonuclease Cas4 (RecB family)